MKISMICFLLLPLLSVYACVDHIGPDMVGCEKDTNSAETLEGFAASSENFLFKPAPKREYQVWYHCLTVQMAVEAFAARNNGEYPGTVDADWNNDGYTVIDLLPSVHLLQNPFTGVCSEPVNGVAAYPGAVAYTVVVWGGTRVGYTITGFGKRDLIVTIAKGPGYYIESFTPTGPGSRSAR